MSRVYDNWERLVAATLKREQLRQIALSHSREFSFSSDFSADFSSSFSFDSTLYDVNDVSSMSIPSYHEAAPSLSHNVQDISFEELEKATKSFQSELCLGVGGFGPAFKGWIHESTLTAAKPGYGMAVAVQKWINEGFQGLMEWLTEINYLSKLRHPNLVKLIGYCSEENNLVLVYEFMPKESHQSLSWATRIKVAVGAARGLAFLHDMEKQVIHRDIKAGNILLDENFNAKLCDFRLADGPTGDMTHVSTQVMVTYGYAAPEYVMTGRLTAKCDVYGFGVVLLELLSGRRVFDRMRVAEEQNLVEWARPYLHKKRKLHQIMDSRMEGQYPQNGAYTVATLVLKCLNKNPKLRPRMAEVLVALEQLSGLNSKISEADNKFSSKYQTYTTEELISRAMVSMLSIQLRFL